MKKAIGLMMACMLALFSLSGCQDSNNSIEALGITVDGGKTVDMQMNQEQVRNEMEEEPSSITNSDSLFSDNWWGENNLSVDYETEDPYAVSGIFVLSGNDGEVISSLGIGLGDSAASVKEKLGEFCSVTDSKDGKETTYSCAYRYTGGKYELVDSSKTIEELTGDSEDAKLYIASFSCQEDKVTSFYIANILV